MRRLHRGPEGRTAQHHLAPARAQEVRQVRVAARELPDLDRALDAQRVAQVGRQARRVQLLARPDRPRAVDQAHGYRG